MNADSIVAAGLAIACAALGALIILVGVVTSVGRGYAIARAVLPRGVARRLGILTIAGATIAVSSAASASVNDPPPATLTIDDDAPVAAASADAAPVKRVTPAAPVPLPAPARAPTPTWTPTPLSATYTVVSGDSFWAIAARITGVSSTSSRDVETVGRYWLRLIAANADRLVEPGNPNLIFPGQVLVVPQT